MYWKILFQTHLTSKLNQKGLRNLNRFTFKQQAHCVISMRRSKHRVDYKTLHLFGQWVIKSQSSEGISQKQYSFPKLTSNQSKSLSSIGISNTEHLSTTSITPTASFSISSKHQINLYISAWYSIAINIAKLSKHQDRRFNFNSTCNNV